ncbi:TrmH family RNA methyltransferase [Tenacibaculum sp. UWU-22]|uniref:TrmH family RNA methyltransferase n=1 Tax=Tenacibaculum sp. UWU-22 TaxID=3234187 RepID=UPI0034DB76EE
MGLSKSQHKFITSLGQKKYRQKHKLFIAEGVKVVSELLNSNFILHTLFVTEIFFPTVEADKKVTISEAELKKISQLKTPNKVLGLFEIAETLPIKEDGLVLALDTINDPGNMGTIIRLCDWFGVTQLVCSKETVDCYNFKVVQASMGSLTRVQINYVDLVDFLSNTKQPTFVADMDGENVFKTELPKEGVLIMGNEANGISDAIKKRAKNKISIPRYGKIQQTESLNVATATAILLSEFRR